MNDFLKQFCAEPGDDFRKWLLTPFSHEQFSYATDGAIMVRVPLIEGFPAATELHTKKLREHVVGLFKPAETAEFISPTGILVPDDQEKSEQVECESCDGRGNDHDCPSCKCTCDDCGGSGVQKKTDKISTMFFGNIYRLKYIRQILSLPGIEIAPATVNEPERIPLAFRFEGGSGVLMPRSARCNIHVELKTTEAA